MRIRLGRLAAAVIVLGVCACSSSGGTKPAPKPDATWFQARPLVMPARPVTTVRPNPFGSLHLPATEAAYDQLRPTQQADLAKALQGVDCKHLPQLTNSAVRVACDADSNAYLLGALLFTGDDVTDANALPPSESVAGWQVSLTLKPPAAARVSTWSAAHNARSQSGEFEDVQTTAKPPCGPTTTTECADFIAYVSDNVVITTPVSFTRNFGAITLDGQFDQAFATRLARRLRA